MIAVLIGGFPNASTWIAGKHSLSLVRFGRFGSEVSVDLAGGLATSRTHEGRAFVTRWSDA